MVQFLERQLQRIPFKEEAYVLVGNPCGALLRPLQIVGKGGK